MVKAPDFDRRVAGYEQHANVQRQAAAWLAGWLPSRCEEPTLELGAGTGFFTRHALRSARRLVATDVSASMVDAGRLAFPRAEWIVADASDPPTRCQPYAAIFTSSLVQWLPDPAFAFRKWHDVCTPGALLLAGWFVRGTMDKFFEACPEGIPFAWRSAEEWAELLAVAGWTVKRAETQVFELTHKSSAAMLRDIHEFGATIPRRVSPGRLRAALRDNDRRHRTEQGVVTPFVFLRVEAVRS